MGLTSSTIPTRAADPSQKVSTVLSLRQQRQMTIMNVIEQGTNRTFPAPLVGIIMDYGRDLPMTWSKVGKAGLRTTEQPIESLGAETKTNELQAGANPKAKEMGETEAKAKEVGVPETKEQRQLTIRSPVDLPSLWHVSDEERGTIHMDPRYFYTAESWTSTASLCECKFVITSFMRHFVCKLGILLHNSHGEFFLAMNLVTGEWNVWNGDHSVPFRWDGDLSVTIHLNEDGLTIIRSAKSMAGQPIQNVSFSRVTPHGPVLPCFLVESLEPVIEEDVFDRDSRRTDDLHPFTVSIVD